VLGFDKYGNGDHVVIVLNDWISDVSSNWECARQYLDTEQFTWVFADLRGYGRSRGLSGAYTLSEAAADVLALAGSSGWRRFSVVGHSMSSLVALHLAQQDAEAIERIAILAPPPPQGFGADQSTIDSLRNVARGDDARRFSALQFMLGNHLSPTWIRFKTERWRANADIEAVAGFVSMFARDGLPDPTAKIQTPLLVITGEQDSEPMRKDAITANLKPISNNAVVVPLISCGHYPMQEAPPLVATLLERFLSGNDVDGQSGNVLT